MLSNYDIYGVDSGGHVCECVCVKGLAAAHDAVKQKKKRLCEPEKNDVFSITAT